MSIPQTAVKIAVLALVRHCISLKLKNYTFMESIIFEEKFGICLIFIGHTIDFNIGRLDCSLCKITTANWE